MFNPIFQRIKNSIHNGGLKDKIFFLHLPKCGGTSICQAIKSCYQTIDIRKDSLLARYDSKASAKGGSIVYGLDYTHGTHKDFPILNFSEEYLAYCMSRKNTKYISGHISFNDLIYKEYSGEFKFITILRDPIKRWISLYFFAKYRKSDRWLIESDILSYLCSDRGKSHGYDYVKFLGGARKDLDYTSRDSIENAKENLHKFEIVGFVEYLDYFIKSFERRFGVRLKIKRKNQSPVSESYRRNFITQEIEEKIREVCKPDIEIYKYAIDNFMNHINNH